ncbi:hypothetical protein ADU86_03840 [Clostridium botulinum]|uniref:hypothetical protein n=1 Tax=Clostridium botulinum TaxID=1491 RepID=UPI0006A4A6DE|nr:hypothetical protein [Clostridium botulinum]KOC47738.1 hypothetical protein ADU86_03840 [Clostridium botulinum]
MEIKDFKNVSVTFTRGNQDAKEKLIEFMKLTGRSKVDIICDALRQYDPYKYFNQQQNNINNNTNSISIDDIKAIVEQTVSKILENKENKNIEVSKIQDLSNKKIDKRFIDED